MNLKSAILCSAIGAMLTGAVLCCSSSVPQNALSYGVGGRAPSMSVRALAGSLPALSPDLQCAADPTEGLPEAEGAFASAPVFGEADLSVFVPEAPEGAKEIVTKQYPSSLSVNNSSSQTVEIDALLAHTPAVDLSGEGPRILIVHTHTTESYNETGQNWYDTQDTRTTDNSRNMVRMGEVLAAELTAGGYGVIHCQKRHDADFNASYDRSLESVKESLKKYPSIAVVIDLHRDSLIDAEGTKYRAVTEIDGIPVAQVMFLMGVGNNTYPHPRWMENLSLAAWIQREACEIYPGLMRPMLVRGLRYNQYLSDGALLVELGGCGNSPEEAEAAARYFGKICVRALDKIREAQK